MGERQLHLPSEKDVVFLHRIWVRDALSAISQTNLPVEFHEDIVDGLHVCETVFNGQAMSLCSSGDKAQAKRVSAYEAIKAIWRTSFVLSMKSAIDETHSAVNVDEGAAPTAVSLETPMDTDNKAAAMMAKMGWSSGSGLGKQQQGISEPITVQQVFFRQGLGSTAKNMGKSPAVFREAVLNMLTEYAHGDQVEDMVFSADLDAEQRKTVHNLSRRFKSLKTVSYGKGDSRQLTVRKARSHHTTVRAIMLECDGETAKYKVYAPGKYPIDEMLDDPALKKSMVVEEEMIEEPTETMIEMVPTETMEPTVEAVMRIGEAVNLPEGDSPILEESKKKRRPRPRGQRQKKKKE